MDITTYIPTYLRADHQVSYPWLQAAGMRPILVVDKADPQNYSAFRHTRINVHGIAEKRAWIAKNAETDKHVVIDDDLELRKTSFTDGIAKAQASRAEVISMFKQIALLANHYPHGGVHRRVFINSPISRKLNYRVNSGGYGSLLFYNRALWKTKPRWTLPNTPHVLEDFISQLEMFTQGLPFAILTTYCSVEIRHRDYMKTGCWAWSNTNDREAALVNALKHYAPPMMVSDVRRVIRWDKWAEALGVPAHLGNAPRFRARSK